MGVGRPAMTQTILTGAALNYRWWVWCTKTSPKPHIFDIGGFEINAYPRALPIKIVYMYIYFLYIN